LIPLAPLLALALLAEPTVVGSPPPDGLAALVAQTVEAYGGRQALERLPAMVQEGEVTSLLRDGAVGRMSRIFQRPGRLRVAIAYGGEGDTERRVVDGARAWRDGMDVSGTPSGQAQALQAARLDLPYLLATRAGQVVDRGPVTRGGRTFHAVTLPLGSGLELTAEIDPGTGQVVRAVGRVRGPAGESEFVTDYSDFRKVSGVLVPFREVSHAMGRRTGEITLSRVELLREAPTGAFQP
jgi:hypothetical protein